MGGNPETSLHENLLVCVLPAHADNRLCGILLETKGGKEMGAKRQEQVQIAPIVTTKGKMRRCRVWLPCSMGGKDSFMVSLTESPPCEQ